MSIKTICPLVVFTIPLIAFRVVCGIDETIETFSPEAVFKNVDFPAEGRPIIVTTPLFILCALASFARGARVKLYLVFGKHKYLCRAAFNTLIAGITQGIIYLGYSVYYLDSSRRTILFALHALYAASFTVFHNLRLTRVFA